MKNADDLKSLYLHQLTEGCDKIKCKNTSCARCKGFLYANKSNDEINQIAENLANNHQKSSKLCDSVKKLVFDDAFRQEQQEFQTFAKTDLSDITICSEQVKNIFKSIDMFSNALNSNNLPLSLSNSRIDDDFFFDFSTKLSKIPEVETKVMGGLYSISQNIIEAKQNFFIYYSNLRAFLILFYFPTVISPDISPPILTPLFKKLIQMKKHQVEIFCNWMSKLTNLRRQMIGYVHFAISLHYSEHSNPSPHSESLHSLIKVLSFLYQANCESMNPLPPSVFYDDHITSSINIENELDLLQRTNLHGRSASLLKKSPFILSLKTKAEICQFESHQLMNLMAQYSMMHSTQSRYTNEKYCTIRVRRSHLIKDAVDKLSHQDSKSFLKKLKVVFEGESAVDVGGPSREFLYLISEKLFSPEFGMFTVVNDKYNWFSNCSFESERSFFLIGAVLGLAIHNSIVLPIRFPLVLYKRLLQPQKKLNLADLAEVDPVATSSLRSLIEMKEKGEDVSVAMLDFSTMVTIFDTHEEVALSDDIPKETEVTNSNLEQYIRSYIEFILIKSIRKQFEAFKKGFEMTCTIPSYKLFEPVEMDTLVSGVEILDWGALKRHTTYSDGYKEDSRQIRWFWEIFNKKFTKEEKLKFLKFATGTDRAPIGGLGSIKLVIQRIKDDKKLPVSHTCFNTFGLPKYKSKAILEEKVKLAIQYTEGFGIR
ncbi:putative E3 ubiquitin-protein ligase HECTD2 [Tritrichomonas foetus]|uniref:HECT-type E3 ubiquitin transferase n=1 Tax=Tritrichomonas foetus TaxID=1144522 RepID=A0A1J4KG66_9EUKA|nr:putative E3 ubiquitin-protein ligase HECTD2 [Tritrichomonas foetus]|eukprot:OHT10203.1 putative E3 ubiquitin-protein ligase HECTD2 [Tritrichomonas foetus]